MKEEIVKDIDPEALVPKKETKEVNLPITRIKYDGLFDWEGLYRLIYRWFIDRGYYFEEPSIKHKVPTQAGEEKEYLITGHRKVNEYVKVWINVFFHFYEMREVEVIKEGKKKKLVKSRFSCEINGKVETDYQKKWESSVFLIHLKNFMDKLILKRDMDTIWSDRHYYIIYKLQTEIRQFLDMQAKEHAYYDMW